MCKRRWLTYGRNLWHGTLATGIWLAFNLQKVAGHWTIPPSKFVGWILFSWLVCYPLLRSTYSSWTSRDDKDLVSYKKRAMVLHQQDVADSHQNRRWTTKGVATNPWLYTYRSTQVTDEIVNPVFIWCEHLWLTFLLILCGPLIGAGRLICWGVLWLKRH